MNWIDEDHKRAATEGWCFRSGYVDRIIRPDGTSEFSGPYTVMYYIYERARQSEWHREAFMSLPWTAADASLASSQGWNASGMLRDWWQPNDAFNQHLAKKDPLCEKALTLITKNRLLKD